MEALDNFSAALNPFCCRKGNLPDNELGGKKGNINEEK